MSRPSRARRILKWTGAVLCVLTVMAWAFSLKYEFELTLGRLWLWLDYYGMGFAFVRPYPFDVTIKEHVWRGWGFTSLQFTDGRGRLFLYLPYWLVLICNFIPTAWLWYRDRRLFSSPPDHLFCRGCGYDLTGNTSGICPECGERRPETASSEVRKVEANG